MKNFTGIWVPLVTPFRHGEVDFPALQALVRHLVDAGVSGLVVCGSTGEAAALSEKEQLAVLDTVLESVPRHYPVAMGLAGTNLPVLLSMQKLIQERPITALLVPPPYYIRPSQQGLVAYYRTVSDAASVPVIVYNIPYRTGIAIELDTMRAIARHEKVVALKDCGGDPAMTMSLISDRALQVLAGEDMQMFGTLCLGGSGAIAASAHIRPDLFVRMARHVAASELTEARNIFYRLLPILQLLYSEPNPGPLKSVLAMTGIMSDELRAPMQPPSDMLQKRLKQEWARLENS